jgi:uncharacterized membrane protein
MTSIIEWFTATLSDYISREAVIFIISMTPILELRGGLLAAKLLGVDILMAIPICVLGNIIPIPFILLFIRAVLRWMSGSRVKFFAKVSGWLDRKVQKHKGTIEKYSYLGIIIFVAVPLPGTGAWTGTLIASVLGLEPKKSFVAAVGGVLMATAIMTVISYCGLGAIFG